VIIQTNPSGTFYYLTISTKVAAAKTRNSAPPTYAITCHRHHAFFSTTGVAFPNNNPPEISYISKEARH
jgi:hypothetical protein